MPHDGALTIRPYAPGDDAAVLQCQNRAFACHQDLDHWRWKFVRNPAGRTLLMLAEHARDGIVGVYGAMAAPALCDGQRVVAGQCVDHCVRSEWLQAGEHGLFVTLGRAFLERWLGEGEGQALFVYGLPTAGWRSGARHLGWQVVRDWDILFRELPGGAPPRPVSAELDVGTVPSFDADVDALFARLAAEFGVTLVRDRAWFDWRYASRPDRRYTLLECRERRSGRLRGVAVHAVADVVRANTGFLLDWLAPADDLDTTTALLGAVERATQAAGSELLCGVFHPMDVRFQHLQELGYRVRGTPWFLTLRTARFDSLYFRERWYFTLGDSDLV